MTEFEIWLYRSLIILLLVIIWFVVKSFSVSITKKIDELINSINELTKEMATQRGEITQLTNGQHDHSNRLNDHGKRIRQLELDRAACVNCKK